MSINGSLVVQLNWTWSLLRIWFRMTSPTHRGSAFIRDTEASCSYDGRRWSRPSLLQSLIRFIDVLVFRTDLTGNETRARCRHGLKNKLRSSAFRMSVWTGVDVKVWIAPRQLNGSEAAVGSDWLVHEVWLCLAELFFQLSRTKHWRETWPVTAELWVRFLNSHFSLREWRGLVWKFIFCYKHELSRR